MAKNIAHGTTSAAAVTTVTLDVWHPSIEVYARGADDLWVRTDRVDPVKGAAEVEVVPAGSSSIIPNNSQMPDQGAGQVNNTEVRIWCDTAIAYSVSGR